MFPPWASLINIYIYNIGNLDTASNIFCEVSLAWNAFLIFFKSEDLILRNTEKGAPIIFSLKILAMVIAQKEGGRGEGGSGTP